MTLLADPPVATLDRALASAADLLDGADGSEDVRRRSLRENTGPLDLACELDPDLIRTPALELISEALERAVTVPGTRIAISIPPQEGKTTLVQHALVRKMQRDPTARNILVQYNSDLATDTGLGVRTLIDRNGSRAFDAITGSRLPDALGISVAADRAAGGNWRLTGAPGGLYSIGVGGGLTGRPADGLAVWDDPYKDLSDADSEATRKRVWSHWTSVGEARFVPETSIVVIHTRWHEDDLIGRLLANDAELPADEREWEHINIPALADGQTPDALGREPGTWLESARKRTAAHWVAIRRRVGERVFSAEYQGLPSPLAGGIFQQAWIDDYRASVLPGDLVATAVAVDPADTGQADEAGILVGSRAADGTIYVHLDRSGMLSQGAWARRTNLAALTGGADTIVQESNLGMGRALRDAWSLLRRQATALEAAEHAALVAVAALGAAGDDAAADAEGLAELVEASVVAAILAAPSTGPARVVAITPRQSKYVRAHAVTGLYETGRARHVGRLPRLEHEMTTWQPGQKSPNRLDTLAHLLTHLDANRAPVSVTRVQAPRGLPTRTASNPRHGGAARSVGRPGLSRPSTG